MPYLIDGHNLIPKISGLSLGDADDENQLVELLLEFCRRRRKEAEVFFDNAPPGQPKARNHGMVIARFVRQGSTADQAIRQRLQRLEGAARNWTVVSSDLEVQAAARRARARVESSEEFARELAQVNAEPESGEASPKDAGLGPDDVDEWLSIFGGEG